MTGADGGMGRIHTRELAKAGYEVIMACIDVFLLGTYCFRRIDTSDSSFFYKGPEWVHVLILVAFAVMPIINALLNLKKWQFHDYVPDMQNIRNVANR